MNFVVVTYKIQLLKLLNYKVSTLHRILWNWIKYNENENNLPL